MSNKPKEIKHKGMKFLLPPGKKLKDYDMDKYIEESFQLFGCCPCDINYGLNAINKNKKEIKEKKVYGKQDFLNELKGMKSNEAMSRIREKNFECRIVSIDGEAFMVTHDFHENRINLTVKNGIIEKVHFG